MELFKLDAGIDLVHVPYKESGAASRDLVANVINAMIMTVSSAVPLVQTGRIRVLANLGDTRSSVYPGAPTLKEEGFPSTAVGVWVALVAPAGTPPEIVDKLNAEMNAILQLPDFKEVITKQGLVLQGGRPDRLAQLMKGDFERWSRAVAAAKIKAD
jgi:tripartite-type tricarboxylate transporter receptor subunit TctC